jgi:hypothetical protein
VKETKTVKIKRPLDLGSSTRRRKQAEKVTNTGYFLRSE